MAFKIKYCLLLFVALLGVSLQAQTKKNKIVTAPQKEKKETLIDTKKREEKMAIDSLQSRSNSSAASIKKIVNKTKDTPARIEIQAEDVADDFTIEPLGSEGILNIYKSEEGGENGKKKWVFTSYNNALQQVWTLNYSLNRQLIKHTVCYDEKSKTIYLLYVSRGATRQYKNTQKGDFVLLSLNIITKQFIEINVPNSKPFAVKELEIMDKKAIIAGYTSLTPTAQTLRSLLNLATFFIPKMLGFNFERPKAASLCVDLQTKKTTPILFAKQVQSIINSADKAPNGSIGLMMLGSKTKKDPIELNIQMLNKKGDLCAAIPVPLNSELQATDGQIALLDNDDYYVLGSYRTAISMRAPRFNSTHSLPARLQLSEGLYFAKYTKNNAPEFIKYVPFKSIPNMTELAKKYPSLRFNSNTDNIIGLALTRNVIKRNDNEYIVFAETYHPEYRTYTIRDAQGQMQINRELVGYSFDVAILVGINISGEVLWTNTFEINSALSWNLNQKTQVMKGDNNDIQFVYCDGENVHYNTLNGSKLNTENLSTPLTTNNKDEELSSRGESESLYWYDNFFLTYVEQKIIDKSKNKTSSNGDKSKRKRFVYSINKIGF